VSRKELEPSDITALADSREQTPVDLDLTLPTEKATLYTGDYSVKGLEKIICIERKSLPDLIACVGRERERFEKCIQRMKGYAGSYLVIETSLPAILSHDAKLLPQWRGQITPTQVEAALNSWGKHVQIREAHNHALAGRIISGILFSEARDRWRELQSFLPALKIAT
jgi:ERCC4-type nuclease